MFDLSFPKAIAKILEDKHLFKEEVENKVESVTVEHIQAPNNFKYFNDCRISTETVTRFGVSNARALYVNESLCWRATEKNPIFTYSYPSGRYKWYRPLSQNKKNKWKSNCKLEDVFGYLQLPAKGNVVFITSSAKDVMTLYELGYPAIAFSSEIIPTKGTGYKFVRTLIDHLESRFDVVLLFLDNDEAGKKYTQTVAKTYNIKSILLPDNEPKDITDYHVKYNTRKTRRTLNKLIKNAIIHSTKSFEDFVRTVSESLVSKPSDESDVLSADVQADSGS